VYKVCARVLSASRAECVLCQRKTEREWYRERERREKREKIKERILGGGDMTITLQSIKITIIKINLKTFVSKSALCVCAS